LTSISEKFGVDLLLIMIANDLEPDSVIFIGQQILIPDPNVPLPTATPLPPGLPRGFLIEYRVVSGDTLTAIALRFNSTVDAILEANEELEDANSIEVGQILTIPINLVTPGPTSTALPQNTPGSIFTLTPTP